MALMLGTRVNDVIALFRVFSCFLVKKKYLSGKVKKEVDKREAIWYA